MSLEQVPKRIYAQYRDKKRFVEWLAILRKQGTPLDIAAQRVAVSYVLDKVRGQQLDVIGRIVVIDRNFINNINLDAIQFGGDEQCGDEDAMFSASTVGQDSLMSDDLFRLIIKAKILKNNRDATIEDVIEQMVTLTGLDYIKVNNPENMSFSIDYSGNITPLQQYALLNQDVIQIPQGVEFTGFNDITGVIYFGGVEQFGDDNAIFSDFGGE